MIDRKFYFAVAVFTCVLTGQTTSPPPATEPGTRLKLVPSEPLTEPHFPKPAGSEPARATQPVTGSAPESKVRPAVLNLKPASDPIYLVEDSEPGPEEGQWRTFRRPKVDPVSRNAEGIALQGYDVISYFEKHPDRGRKEFSVEREGVTWLFSSSEHRRLFLEDPDRFVPQYGGFCAYSVAKGYPATADALAYEVDGSKLYLFYDKAVQTVWREDQRRLVVRAERNWPNLHR